jgi:recombination protein RecA
MEKRKKALLVALVLGDGYIRKDHRSNTCSLKLCHSEKQKEYLEYKARLLQSLLGGKEVIVNRYVHKWPDGKSFVQYRCERADNYFRILRNMMYPNKYSQEVLRCLTPEALAIWYMDDGSIVANNRWSDGSVRSARTQIHTCTTQEIAQDICDYFLKTWGIKFTTYKDGKGTYSIRCFHKEGRKFHELIHPFITPSMQYKQRFYYPTSAQPLDNKGDDIV